MSSIESDWRDRYEWPTEDTWVLSITRRVVNAFLRIACKVNVEGLESIPLTGSLVVAANHLHSFDPFLVGR